MIIFWWWMSDTMNKRFFTIFWVSFAMMLALIVGVIAYDFCLEDEGELGVLQEERIAEKKRRKIKQVRTIDSETKPIETEAQLVEDVVGEGDDEPQKTESEIAYEEWEKIFDGLVKLQNEGKRPTAKQVADFKAAFDKLSDEVKLENIPHAQNLFTDASIEYLTAILFDTKESEDVLSSIYYDLLNRPEALKMPIIRKLAADKSHPLSEEAFDLLVMVDDLAIGN
jgi:hypothetical protein